MTKYKVFTPVVGDSKMGYWQPLHGFKFNQQLVYFSMSDNLTTLEKKNFVDSESSCGIEIVETRIKLLGSI